VNDSWQTSFLKRQFQHLIIQPIINQIFRPPKEYESLWRLFIGNLKRHVFKNSFMICLRRYLITNFVKDYMGGTVESRLMKKTNQSARELKPAKKRVPTKCSDESLAGS